jgi:RNA polymerase sigma-70 factor (TIGR02960 family)
MTRVFGEVADLALARDGDEQAFARLIEPHRAELHRHCYRMLGSVHDADDALQESMVRAWNGLAGFDGGGPIRPWLFRIATNRCLTLLDGRKRRELPADLSPGAPLTEVAWLEPYADDPQAGAERRESVALAFVAAVQHLAPQQRAALLLREVLGFSAAEVADQLGTSVPAINSALQRARKTVAQRAPQPRSTDDDRVNELAERYAAAWHAADVDAIVAMLAEDATFSMPPLAEWFRGHADIREFLLAGPLRHRWRMVPCRANGQLAFGAYIWDDQLRAYRFGALDVMTVDGDRFSAVVAFLSWDLWEPFGLPPVVGR